jgi:hypothetical protein
MPSAAVAAAGDESIVTLKSPKLEGGLSKATGPASLFIDRFAAAVMRSRI